MVKSRESEASRVYALGQEGEQLAGSPGKKGQVVYIYPCHLLHEAEVRVVLSLGQLFSPVILEAMTAGPKEAYFPVNHCWKKGGSFFFSSAAIGNLPMLL